MIKKIILTKEDLCSAIFNANACGFTHSKMHKYFIPDDIKHTEEEKEAIYNNDIGPITDKRAKKFVKKIQEHFRKRRVISAHLFAKEIE